MWVDGVGGGKSLSKTVQRSSTVKPRTPCIQSTGIVVRLNGHNCGYNPRSMPSIWYTPQALSCHSHSYTVLIAALRKAD